MILKDILFSKNLYTPKRSKLKKTWRSVEYVGSQGQGLIRWWLTDLVFHFSVEDPKESQEQELVNLKYKHNSPSQSIWTK